MLDTNIVVSALLFDGPVSAVRTAWQSRQFVMLSSKALLEEAIRVLHYPKFRLSPTQLQSLIETEFLPYITPVRVTHVPAVIRGDPADDHVLACAVAGQAHVIVTGDRHLMALGCHGTIPLLTAASFLTRLRGA